MRTNLLVQTLKVSAKRINLNHIAQRVALIGLFITLAIGNVWAHSTHNGKVTFYNATGSGTVYLSTASGSNTGETNNSNPGSKDGWSQYTWSCDGSSDKDAKTLYPRGTVAAGYYYLGWSTSSTATSGYSTGSLSANASSDTDKKIYGYFETIKVTAAPSNVNINATDPTATYPDAGGVVLSFTTSNSNGNGDFTTGGSGDSRWVISAWPTHASATSTTFNYKFVGNGSYGTNNRTLTKTVTLKGLNDATVKTCTLTAKYPNPKVIGGDDLEISTAFNAAGAQTDVEKTAEFDVVYGDNGNNFTASFSGIAGGGTWNVTGITVNLPTQKATVTYTFNGNKSAGTHQATLTLTANDCNGWNDTGAAGSTSAAITITAENEQEADYDVEVYNASGTKISDNTTLWAAGLALANANAGSTLKLMRDIDLTTTYGITATQGITQTFTLDLNGKTLSAAINGSVLNPKTAGKILTIKDSKTGGKIENITPNYNGVTYGINISAGDVVLESGTIHAENNAVFNHSSLASLGTRAVKLAANTKFTMSGGTLEAKGGREVYGIYQESSSANNTADKSVVTISGGTIKAEAPALVYGIRSYGKVNMSGGTIDVTVNTEAVNSNTSYVAANFNDNTLHRYGYGIRMYATSSATLASNYFGTLTMTGGTINVTNLNKTMNGTTLYNEHIYGVKMEVSPTGAGAGKTAPDGTKVMKACAIGSIENATITLTHTGVLGYGVMATGCYNSVDNKTTPLQIKNSTINVTTFQTAYGVYADAYVNWNSTLTKLTGNGGCTYGNIELTNTTINATTTGGTGAYCGWVACTSGTVANAKATTGSTSEGNGTYYGEYAAAGKIVVNSGTYTASAATSSAYGFASSDRARCVRNINGVFTDRDAAADPTGSLSTNETEAYPELYIHGGDISATTGTSTTAIAVKSGGNTVIDGGTFNAYAGTTTAYGLYVTAGKTTASGVTFPASATTKAYGVYVTGGISNWSLFTYYGEVELNNCNATATARTTTDARGLFVEGSTKVYTQAQFDAMKSANNSDYKNYGDYAQVGERSFVAKATINGGTYTATAETTTAYGIVVTSTRVSTNKEAIAYSPLTVKNATITAKTNTGTTAYGVQLGGGGLIENCTISATAGTKTASGVRAIDKTAVIKNSTITAKGSDEVYGLEGYVDVSTANGNCWHGDFDLTEAGSTKVTAESTGATKAYTIYLNAKAINIASGTFAGDYATAANAIIDEGEYIAKTNGGTSGYVLALAGQKTSGSAIAQPEVEINGGKFNGATAEIGTAGVVGHLQLKGGVYVHNTNLDTYVPISKTVSELATTRPEYTEGYRYEIVAPEQTGNYVCQIGSTKYKSLETALAVVTSGQTILMIANYTLPAGDYILPANTTLLIPCNGQSALKEHPDRVYAYTPPSAYRKLTFASGAHLDVFGTIQAGGKQAANGQLGGKNGSPHETYGWICMDTLSSMTLEANSKLYAWGYVTGKGTIDAKRDSKVYEMFQMTDWRGGSATSSLAGNSKHVMPMNQYYIQNIECPITFRPGAAEYCDGTVNASSSYYAFNDVKFIGVTGSGSFFMMANEDMSEDTWVRKSYDAVHDKQVYELNSSASIGGISLKISGLPLIGTITVNSTDYVMPITNNIKIHLLSGDMYITQDMELTPGAEIEIDKEATAYVNSGVSLHIIDLDEWDAFATNVHTYPVPYSPTWGTVCPRGKKITKDADVNVHGKFVVNGNLYTTAGGANIFSTNEDAGTITYGKAAPSSSTTLYVANNTGPTYNAKTSNPAWLKNADSSDPWSYTSGTALGKSWVYYDNKWQCWTPDGCFTRDAQNKPYAKPAAYVELTSDSPDGNHLHHDAATGARNFVWDENCYWWEVVTTPTAEGYYLSLNADNNGKYNYYYYDSAAACWKIKTVTVTWRINGANTNYTVGYGTKPKWLGATPTKSSGSSDFSYIWNGWKLDGGDGTLLSNDDLPVVTTNTIFDAQFYEKYVSYRITFKNSDGTVLDSRNWNKGSTPSYAGTPEKAPTTSTIYTFNGTWTPGITTVSGEAEYVANYNESPRPYEVTFLDYNYSELEKKNVNYGTAPSYTGSEPTRAGTSAYSYEFSGWTLQSTGVFYAKGATLPTIGGTQNYIANYNQVELKYLVQFWNEDGSAVLWSKEYLFDATPAYGGSPATPVKSETVEYTYAFNGWAKSVGGAKLAALEKVEGAQNYYALFTATKRKYIVSFNMQGHGTAVGSQNIEYGNKVTEPSPAPSAAGWTFGGWYKEAGCTNAWNFSSDIVTGTRTLYAKWTEVPTYAITYDKGVNGTGTIVAGTKTHDVAFTLSSSTFTREGYTQTGWSTADGGAKAYDLGGTYTANAAITLYPFWTANTYTITYNKGANGTGTIADGTKTHGVNFTLSSSTFTRVGYTQTGWSTADGGAKAYDLGGTYTANAAITLYPFWTANTYTITYNKGTNGTGTIADGTKTHGVNFTLSSSTFTRVGYTQTGWSTADGGAKAYELGGTYTANAAITLYPFWTINTYTVTIAQNDASYGTVSAASIANVPYNSTITVNGNKVTVNGTTVTATPTAATTQYTYAFDSWTNAPGTVTGAMTITANFTRTTNKYTVTFIDGNGNTLTNPAAADNKWEYGATPNYTGAIPTKTEDASNTYTFNDTWSPAIEAVTGNATYTAQFDATPKASGLYVDIVDVVNTNASSGTLTLNVTNWPSAGWPYTINEVSYASSGTPGRAADRTLTIPYSGAPGDNFVIDIKKNGGESYSHRTYKIPEVISSATLTDDKDRAIFVKGGTLTVNGNITTKNIYVGADAKLVINSGKTLTADTIFLRTTTSGAAELKNNGSIATKTKLYYTRIIKDKSRYYQFGLPLSCSIDDVKLSDGKALKYSTAWLLREYSESSRANNGGAANNWVSVADHATIVGGKGYEMFSASNYYREFYFPVDHTDLATNTSVTVSYTSAGDLTNRGWNVLVSPLTATCNKSTEPEGISVCWMELDGWGVQEQPTSIPPMKPFAYQASQGQSIVSFAGATLLAPRRRVAASEEEVRIQWMHLDIEDANGMGDQTSIYSHPTRYEQTYKTGIDVAKQALTSTHAVVYSSHAYGDMAFAGVADSQLEQGVALTVYSPSEQELMISMRENDWLNRMEHVWLIDNETGLHVDLIESDYAFRVTEGTTRGRLFIQGQFKAPQITTDIEGGAGIEGEHAQKVIIDQKIYIRVNGRLYDATGKLVLGK